MKQRPRGPPGFWLDVYVACSLLFLLLLTVKITVVRDRARRAAGLHWPLQGVCAHGSLFWWEGGGHQGGLCISWSSGAKCVRSLFFCTFQLLFFIRAPLLTCSRQLSYRRMNVRLGRGWDHLGSLTLDMKTCIHLGAAFWPIPAVCCRVEL